MDTLKQLREELTEEHNTTKKFLNEFPEGKNDYAPHEKSMKLMHLAQHITEVFGWASFMLKTEFLISLKATSRLYMKTVSSYLML
ncbi:hypothetical protein [Niabella ginsengisoli]|uniref:DinB family protein n=1 Tax=Niabella ginsengisoli TaxID=522298 RepID=A0ABS9SRB8_9BACT|nr:hypothetical protein [Niabella ginsengisoli]MCH5600916.1 hypothetical protein [Niabella ginsengisoli]